WKSGDPRTAVEIYDRGLALNRDDFRLHFFRADALFAQGRDADALAGYVRALVLRPRRPSVLGNLNRAAGRLGIVVRAHPFLPHASVSVEGDRIEVDYDDGPWRYYGLCKALWRHERGGEWSTGEEHDCLGVLLDAYHEAHGAPDAALDRLAAIVRDGLLDEFIVYEIGSRLFPDLTLLLADSQREQVRTFVERYVVSSTDRVGH